MHLATVVLWKVFGSRQELAAHFFEDEEKKSKMDMHDTLKHMWSTCKH